MTDEPKDVDALMDVLKGQADNATPEQFIRRLETSLIIYAYVDKRFQERYPVEHAAWLARTDQGAKLDPGQS